MADLVERLRAAKPHCNHHANAGVCHQAASEIERLREALTEARPVVMAMTGTEWAGVGKFKSWAEADDDLRAIKTKIDEALSAYIMKEVGDGD